MWAGEKYIKNICGTFSFFCDAGFTHIEQEPFFVTNALEDWFLQTGKYRPEVYLDATVRAGISSFQVSANQTELAQGLNCLQQDIESGKIQEVIRNFESEMGDYLFVVGEKK